MKRGTVPAILLVTALLASIPTLAGDGNEELEGDLIGKIVWKKMGMIMDIGDPGDPDSLNAAGGYVIFDQGMYKMWYSGSDGVHERVMYATSPDGFVWTKHGIAVELGLPGEPDDDYTKDAAVLRTDQGTYQMWYTAQMVGYYGWRIMYATSDNGLDWLKRGVVISKSGKGVGHPFVLVDDSGLYRMWYSEYDTVHWRIRQATSNDGITWTDEGLSIDVGAPGDPDSKFVYEPSVIVEPDGTYLMYYSVYDGNPNNYVDIHYATSPDGTAGSWQKQGLALRHGEPGDYDEVQVLRPMIYRRPDDLHMLWYSGQDGYNGRMMLALEVGEVPINLTASVVIDKDIELNWTIPDFLWLDHYLIYRSTDQRSFDFSNWLHNTSNDPNPLQTTWVDTDAAGTRSPTEYYYVVRAVYSYGLVGTTSNTAGKWTEAFPKGRDAFSLPLEPFTARKISWYSENISGTEFIRWMNTTGHWVTHYPSMGEGVNDIPAIMGDSYEISLSSPTNFTFCGYPASMIRFQEGLGDSLVFRKSLSAQVEGNDINLSWEAVTGAIGYLVFRSEEMNGLHNLSLPPIVNTTNTYWIDSGVIGNERSEYYYTVIPANPSGGLGSSTYSVGVFTEDYQSGTDTFALPLKPLEPHSLDWYCDNIPNVIGIVHMMKGYWRLHAKEMPEGVYDAEALQAEGHQILIDGATTTYTFIGY